MLLKHERNYASGMDALVAEGLGKSEGAESNAVVCAGFATTATTTTTTLWSRMLLEQDRKYAWAWVLWSPYVLGTRTRFCSGHGCPGHRMLFAQERKYALVMDALVAVCSAKLRLALKAPTNAVSAQTRTVLAVPQQVRHVCSATA